MADTPQGIVKPRGRVKSCTACRQVKLRCDAAAKFPAACSRCQSNRFDCRIDSNFKRVSVRGYRLEEITKKVNSLQNNMSPLAADSIPTVSIANGAASESYASPTRSCCAGDWLLLSDMDVNRSNRWCLGEVSLDYQRASELLNFYAKYYYEHVPILDRVESVSEFHDSNPFLFWTIMRISCYRQPTSPNLFEMISKPYQYLLGTSVTAPIRNFKTLQAIILLCYWPCSGKRQSDDPSWQYCGMVLNVAMQMGLDQPGPGRRLAAFGGRFDAHEMSVYTRHMTWLAAFYISTSSSVWLGLPPHISSPAQLNTTVLMAKDSEVPREFLVQIEIQGHIIRYSTALSGNMDSNTSSTLLNFFNDELDAVFTSYKDFWSVRLEIQLLGAKLYLFSLCLNASSEQRGHVGRIGELPNLDSTRVLVQRGLPSAVSLIHNMSKLNNESRAELAHKGGDGPLAHYPKYFFRLVMFAVVFLMKFLTANPRAAQEDRELAISHITMAHQFYSSFTSCDISRVAEVIESLLRGLRDDPGDPLPPIRTRLGASLMYNSLKAIQLADSALADTATIISVSPDSWEPQDDAAMGVSGNVTDDMYHDFGGPGIQEGLEDLQWMSDDMLLEMFNL